MNAMKSYIKELVSKNGNYFTIRTVDLKFRHSQYFKKLMLINSSRNISSQGYVKSSGVIFSESHNKRLKYADNRFILKASTTKLSRDKFQTWWSVDNRYDYESFEKSDKYTELPLRENQILKLPDGLSEYMDSGLKIAKPFEYIAKWNEVWG
jgi:hypothetical protein